MKLTLPSGQAVIVSDNHVAFCGTDATISIDDLINLVSQLAGIPGPRLVVKTVDACTICGRVGHLAKVCPFNLAA